MTYVSTEIEDALLVRWEEVTVDAVSQLVAWVNNEYKREGKPMAYAAIVPTESPIPGAEARRALLDGYNEIAELCSTVRLVILGSGFRRAAIRAVSAGFMLAIPKHKDYSVDNTATAAFGHMAENCRVSAERLMEVAVEKGIVVAGEE
ncbi:MAG: hypothetical protein AAF799_47845 [Myxococcota bacterium]